jgi:hypothetical protein
MKRVWYALGVLLLAATAQAATITVCASGCTNTNSQLQAALDAAAPGDTISLQENFVYIGDFIIPNQKTCGAQDATCIITVQTGVTSTGAAVPSTNFPLANVRIAPSYAANLAKIQPTSNTSPAFRTTYPEEIRTNCAAAPCVSKWWTFKNLEIRSQNYGVGTTYGGFTLMTLGSNDSAAVVPASNPQNTVAEAPSQITIDRVLMHGDPVMGQKYGISINAKDVTIRESYIYDIKCTIPDCSAINAANTPGNVTIINNYLQASTENFISGGTDIQTMQIRNITSATTTSITLASAPVDLANTDAISCFVGSGVQITSTTQAAGVLTVLTATAHGFVVGDVVDFVGVGGVAVGSPRGNFTVVTQADSTHFTVTSNAASQTGGVVGKLSSIQTSKVTNIAGSVITISPAMSAGCQTTGTALWNLVPKTLSFTKNWLAKDTNWMNPITPTPQNIVVTTSATGGTLPAGTQTYRVIANTSVSSAGVARSTASSEGSVVSAGTTSSNTITWSPVTNANYYHIYGRSAGGENFRMYVTTSACTGSPVVCSVVDTNAATVGACSTETTNNCTLAVPTSVGTKWQVKNLFELKNWDGATIEGNVFEYVWSAGQIGYGILFTLQDQSGANWSNVVANVIFRNNIVRHTNGGFQVSSSHTGNPSQYSQISHDISITNNLLYDLGSAWSQGSATGLTVTLPGGMRGDGPEVVTFDHNTMIQSGGNETFAPADSYTGGGGLTDFVVKNNMWRKLTYGSYFMSGQSEGNVSWTASTQGTSVWTKNVAAGGNCSIYPSPSTNFCPTDVAWQAEFIDYAGGNYRLKATSAYHNAGLDGTDLGANVDAIEAFTNIALSGNNTGTPPPQPVITTTSPLGAGTVGAAYTKTLQATNGTPPYTWTITAGALPTGLTLAGATGVISGTPTVPSTTAFTATVTDAAAQTANLALSVDIIVAVFPEPRPDKYGPNARIFLALPVCDDSLDQLKVGDQCFDLTNNLMKCVLVTSPAVVWGSCNAGGAPVILSGFMATAPSIVASNGVQAFEINVGTGTAASSGVLTMPWAAATGWVCTVNNLTAAAAHRADNTRQTVSTTTTVTLENQTTSTGAAVNWTASDKLRLHCRDY